MSASQQGLPLLYTHVEALAPESFKGKSLKEIKGFEHVKNVQTLPLNAVEFFMAAGSYPIVFVTTNNIIVPSAVMGLRANENLFVGDDSQWDMDAYIPSYVRRYPFIFFEDKASDQLVLCIDQNKHTIGKSKKNQFFDDNDEPTDITKHALQFCEAFQQQFLMTTELCHALNDKNLLVDHNAQITLKTGEKTHIEGFQVIDDQAFNKLSNEDFVTFRKKGWLPAIYAHFVSMSAWTNLINRAV